MVTREPVARGGGKGTASLARRLAIRIVGGQALAMALACSALACSAMACSAMAETLPGYPPAPEAPKGAPNILLIMTDDVGFAASTAFGGAIPTPTFDALAARGLRYNNFNTTALCSPTRAALLTGRNHHAVGFGSVSDFARGEPGYSSVIPHSAATIAQVLRQHGYNSAFLGKNHNVPSWQSGPLGPFDQWGTGLGFDYFYGFNGGLTDQFAPALIEGNRSIEPPRNDPGYILDRDLADHAIDWLRMQRVQGGGKPFFLYYAPGTAHAPLQAPREWIERFRGEFDGGWDLYRRQSFERQKRLGVIPAGARLAPLPAGIPRWNSLTPDQKRVYARLMEAYAAALAYADAQIGRVIDELKSSGRFDNTLILYIQGDNGASAEGGENGSLDYAGRLPPADELAYALEHLDDIGGPDSYPIAPAGWAVALNTPFPYYKVVASRLGGVRNGMVVSWPAGQIKDPGAIRSQFLHVTDVAPTIYDLIGIEPPASVNGVPQQPIDGASFASTFAQPGAASAHEIQYFEILGNAAIYQDGWLAASRLLPSGQAGHLFPDMKAPWALFDLNTDFSQTTDVSRRYPERLARLRSLFDREAKRNKVYPMSDKPFALLLPQNRPEVTAQPGSYTFFPDGHRYSDGTFPSILNRSWTLQAVVETRSRDPEGMIVTQGGRFSGWGLYLIGGHPTFAYRASNHDESLFRLTADRPIEPGRHVMEVSFAYDGGGVGRGGRFELKVDGEVAGTVRAPATVPFKFAPEDASIGFDGGTSLTEEYLAPFSFSETIHAVTLRLQPVQLGGAGPVPVGIANAPAGNDSNKREEER